VKDRAKRMNKEAVQGEGPAEAPQSETSDDSSEHGQEGVTAMGTTVETPAEAPSAEQSETDRRMQELEQQVAQYKDLFLRKAADFDNFKRRTENEISALVKFANEDMVLAFLPVVDDIERALKSAPPDESAGSLRKGIELILQKITKVLENNGVKPMETIGKVFDVNFHDVLLQIQKPGAEPHTIVEEVERGYQMNDKVIRHAKVIVAAAPDEGPADARDQESTDNG